MKKIVILIFTAFQIFAQKQSKIPQNADLIVYNSIVYTVDQKSSTAQAFAIKDGLFLEIGKSIDILKKYNSKKIIDAKGKSIYPGFYDPHSHFFNYAINLSQADCIGSKSFDEIINRLKKFQLQNPNNQWIIGQGWDQNDWAVKQFPNKEMLDKVFPKIPVALTRIDGHALLLNSEALKRANINATSKADGGLVELKNGEPTGILIDKAMRFVKTAIPKTSKAELTKLLKMAEKDCFKLGLTTISDAGISTDNINLLDELHKTGQLKIRDYAMVSISDENLSYWSKKEFIKPIA